jgi:hypothetical protein
MKIIVVIFLGLSSLVVYNSNVFEKFSKTEMKNETYVSILPNLKKLHKN